MVMDQSEARKDVGMLNVDQSEASTSVSLTFLYRCSIDAVLAAPLYSGRFYSYHEGRHAEGRGDGDIFSDCGSSEVPLTAHLHVFIHVMDPTAPPFRPEHHHPAVKGALHFFTIMKCCHDTKIIDVYIILGKIRKHWHQFDTQYDTQ